MIIVEKFYSKLRYYIFPFKIPLYFNKTLKKLKF